MDWLSIIGLLVFLILGIAIILFFAKIIWFLLPATIVAVIVFFLTFDLTWTGIAFLIIAVLSLFLKLRRKR
jgi:membrane protein implicated in regulation of membrane protease activity